MRVLEMRARSAVLANILLKVDWKDVMWKYKLVRTRSMEFKVR